MYDERPYGEILRDERERNGYDLNSISRRLHIRPDILMAIEQSDFDRMPAKGYAKNMVRAYARALNLDDRQITDMFLDQAHMHDVGESRRPSSGYSERPRSRSRSYSRDLPSGSAASRSRRASEGRYSSSRSLDLDSDPYSRSARRSEYPRSTSRSRSVNRDLEYSEPSRSRQLERERSSNRGSRAGAGSIFQSLANRGNRNQTKVGRPLDTFGANPPYARNNVVGRGNSLAGLNLPLILVIVAALIVLIIVVVVVTNGSHQAVQDVPDIPISGLTDTSGTDSGSSSDEGKDDSVPASSVVLPESAEVVLEVADGQDSWVEIYENGSSTPSLAEVLSGPSTQAYDVENSIRIRTANPSALTITVEDERVELSSEGNGNYSYTFSFKDYLKQWKKDNGVSESSSKSKKSSSSKSSSS